MVVWEVPAYYLCRSCGHALAVRTPKEPVVGKAVFMCHNPACVNHEKPHWVRFREVTLETETRPNDLV